MKKGSVHSLDTRKKMSKIRKGKTLKELGHKINCQCAVCKTKRNEYIHSKDCQCYICKNIRGETKGKNHPRWKEKINIKCWGCGDNFEVSFSKKNISHYCSQECYFARDNKVKIECLYCHKKFKVSPSNKNIAKFCSKKCSGKYHSGVRSHNYVEKVKKFCLECGEEMLLLKSRINNNRGKFCSKECFGKYQHKIRGEKHPLWKEKIRIKCLYCKEYFDVSLCRKNTAKFCSKKCSSSFRKGKLGANYIHGEGYNPYSLLFNKQLKEKVRVRDNFVCQLCGVPELEFNKQLSIHHIDYNKENNVINNLVSLCNKCHLKTNGKRDYWTGYFKELLRKEYGYIKN
jgi:hypothetical protein